MITSEKMEVLTLNIFELLPCDVQMNTLTFLRIQDLYQVALSCQHGAYLVLSPEADEYVWKSMAGTVGSNNEEMNHQYLEQEGKEQHDKEKVKATWKEWVRFNLIKWDPNTRPPNSVIEMHNNDKTIASGKQGYWETIRTNRKLEMGMIHCWEYALDDHDNSSYNTSRIFVGIERSTYAFTEAGSNKIIGYNSEGIGYNIGKHSVYRGKSFWPSDTSVLHEQHFVFSTGDTIGIKLDLKNLSCSKKASMHLFKNNKYFMTISDIATKDIVYYPAISVAGHQRVSIRMKHSSMLCIESSNE